jgi:phosphatidate cytidylyltransferase
MNINEETADSAERRKPALKKGELFYRLVSAFFFLPALVIIARAGGIYYMLLIELAIGVGAYEFFRILEVRGLKPYTWMGVTATLILGWNAYFASHIFTFMTLTVLFFVVSISELRRKSLDRAIYHISATVFGVFYVGWLMSHLTLLRQIPAFLHYGDVMSDLSNLRAFYFLPHEFFGPEYATGATYALLPFLLAWANDSGAFFIGRKFGKHKVLRRVSPGKSWEGLIGGGVCGLVAILLFGYWTPWLKPIDCLVLGILAACAAPVGDFVESLLKRDAHMKDTGATIPGHGGILDRFDSVLFVAPIVYYYLRFFVVH